MPLKSARPRAPKRTHPLHPAVRTTRPHDARHLAISALIATSSTIMTGAANADDNWAAGSGAWDTAGNWADSTVPGVGDRVTIANGGQADVQAPGAQASDFLLSDGILQIAAGGSLTTADDTGASVVDATVPGTLLVVNGSLSTGNNALIAARSGRGRMLIRNGGSVSSGTGSRIADSGGFGNIGIEDAGSTWHIDGDLTLGDGGTGTAVVTVSDGGRLRADRVVVDSDSGGVRIGGTATGGIVAAEAITRGGGGDTLEVDFFHTDDDYHFTTDGTAGGDGVSIDGNLEVTFRNSGKTTLAGPNTYSGDTTIQSDATVSVSDGESLGSQSSRLILDQGTLETTASLRMDRTTEMALRDGTIRVASGTLHHAGDVVGAGRLIKTGDGTLMLSGANDYSGGFNTAHQTDIRSGTVSVGADTHLGDPAGGVRLDGATLRTTDSFTTGRPITLAAAGGTFSVAGGTALTHGGTLTGAGTLTKTGGGTLIVDADNDYTGATSVDGGRLEVNGSIVDSPSVTVNAGGELGGTGTVGATTIGNGGTLAPGNSIGSLHVDGDITFDAGSTYTVEADADGNADRVEATGQASIDGGRVAVMAASGDYAEGTDYTILRADGGVSGAFDGTTSNLAFLAPSLTYGANEVTLTLTRNATDFASVADTPNQRAVANALTAAADTGADGAAPLLTAIQGMDAAGARGAFDNLSGVQHTHARSAVLHQSRRLGGIIRGRLGAGAPGKADRGGEAVRVAFAGEDWARVLAARSATAPGTVTPADDDEGGLWVRALGGDGEIDATDNAAGSDYSSATVAIGVDTRLDNGIVVGLAGSYGRTDTDTGGGELDTDSYQLAGYAGWRDAGTWIDAGLGVGLHRTDSARTVTVGGTPRAATADYETRQYSASLEIGRDWYRTERSTVAPFLGLDVSGIEREGFTENGAGAANLDVDEESETSVRTRLGARVSTSFDVSGGLALEPGLSLAWVREHGNRDTTLSAHFAPAPATTFRVDGPKLDRDRAAVGVGVAALVGGSTRLNLEYSGDIADSDSHHGIALTWRTHW